MNICFVAHNAYGMMTDGISGHAGGVERQTSLMSKCLASKGHQVSVLTWDEGQDGIVNVDGVRIIKMCRQDAGIPVLRFFTPRWTSLNRAMRKADAELYYHNCAEYVTGQIALWCKANNRYFIYSVARDTECELISPDTKKLHDRIFYRHGIRNADRIIVQTKRQQQMLIKNFHLQSVVLPMPCLGNLNNEYQSPYSPKNGKYRVLWVGRIDKEKRLELLLDIAESFPDVLFDIAGKPSNSENSYVQNLLARAKTLSNVRVLGMVPKNRMPDLYSNSSILCCTSIYEGFPNTFLEAWSYGLPVVSTFDPDNIIINKKLGVFAKNKDELITGIKTILESPALWKEMSDNARQYFTENHNLDKAMEQFEKVFLETIQSEK